MAFKPITFKSKQYQQMVDLRYRLLREPLGLQFSNTLLEQEEYDILLGYFNDSETELIGCCILSTL